MPSQLPPTDPIEQQPEYSYEIELDGRTYLITLRWHERPESWYLTLARADGSVMLRARRLVVDYPLILDLRAEGRPPGSLALVDRQRSASTGERECDYDDLGRRCSLLYWSADELESSPPPAITFVSP